MHKKEKIYLPTFNEVILLPLLSFVFFTVVNLPVTYRRFLSAEEVQVSSSYFNRFMSYLNNDVANSIGIFLFWAVIGLLAYAILSCLVFVVQAFRSDIPMQRYSVFRSHTPSGSDAFPRLILRSIALTMLLVWLITNAFLLLRDVNNLFIEGLVNLRPVNVIGAILITAFDVFVMLFLLRLFLLRRHIPGE